MRLKSTHNHEHFKDTEMNLKLSDLFSAYRIIVYANVYVNRPSNFCSELEKILGYLEKNAMILFSSLVVVATFVNVHKFANH